MTSPTDVSSLLAAGLSQEEAECILSRRQVRKEVAPPGGRLALARQALMKGEAKVGVASVQVTEAGLEKSELQDLEALERFYSTKGGSSETPAKSTTRRVNQPVVATEDQSQDPEDY